jgi:hypothetical protein
VSVMARWHAGPAAPVVTKGLAKTIRAMADGTLDSQVGVIVEQAAPFFPFFDDQCFHSPVETIMRVER